MLVTVWLAASTAWADPSGSALRVDQLATIRIDEQRIGIEYSATLNRPGAFQEFLTIDADGDGELSMEEQKTYFDEVRRQIMAGLEITAGGRELRLRQAGEMAMAMPFTKIFRFEADQPAAWAGGVDLEFHNDNYLAHDGDVAIRVDPAEGVKLDFCSLSQQDRSRDTANGLPPPSYAPRQQRDVVVRYGGSTQPDAQPAAAAAVKTKTPDRNRGSDVFSLTSFVAASLGVGIAVLAWLTISMVMARRRGARVRPRRAALAAVVCLVVLCSAWCVREAIATPSGGVGEPISDDVAIAIFRGLHENIYGAFQAETESDLYDALAASLDGDLLSRTYLQVSRLTMRDDRSDGFFVRRVKPLASEVLPAGPATTSSFRVYHRWRVYGVVSHAGHRHARVNEFEAAFSVDTQEGGWRITAADLRGYHRADPNLLFASTAP